MQNRLYVSKLPYEPNKNALRELFEQHGTVFDFALVADRKTGRAKGAALVTMGSDADARRAQEELDGAPFEGQRLSVEVSAERTSRADAAAAASDSSGGGAMARITQQFRQAAAMTYELDCAGSPLILRIFFPPSDGPADAWRIEARSSNAADAKMGAASDVSRTGALRALGRWWSENERAEGLSPVDWTAVEKVMIGVRAL